MTGDLQEEVQQLRALEQRAERRSAEARPQFERRGRLLPRERLGLLLDAGTPFLPLGTLAGYLQDTADPEASIPGAGVVAGIGFVRGRRCLVVAIDSGIVTSALPPLGARKLRRLQEIATRERLPLVLLGDAGCGPVEAGLAPLLTVQHGAATPRGSGVVVAVGWGDGDYLARDDREALGLAREVLARAVPAPPERPALEALADEGAPLPHGSDPRSLMLHLSDDGALLDFRAHQAPELACAQARIGGLPLGWMGQAGSLDVTGLAKAGHFVLWLARLRQPLVHLQHDASPELEALLHEADVPRIVVRSTGAAPAEPAAARFTFAWPHGPAFARSGQLQDDGVIDPRDTRAVLAFLLATMAEAA